MTQHQDKLLSTQAAAAYLGMTVRFLENRRVVGGGPRFIRLSRRTVRYRQSDLEAWLDQRVMNNTSETINEG